MLVLVWWLFQCGGFGVADIGFVRYRREVSGITDLYVRECSGRMVGQATNSITLPEKKHIQHQYYTFMTIRK